MLDFFHNLFSGAGFIPRAQCGAWTPGLIRLHNFSDFLIWTAYLAIPAVLVKFAYSRRHDLPFRQLFWLFGLFILACGTTHLMDIVLFYNPIYRFAGLIKLITAAASWGTVAALFHVAPRALQMRSPDDFKREIEQRQQIELNLNDEIRKHRETEVALQTEIANRQRLEAEWKRIFDLSPDKLSVNSFDGYFKRINPAWEQSLGYTEEELLSQPVLSFVHPDDVEKTISEGELIRSGKNTESFENRFRCKDGSYKWLVWRSRVVPEEELIYAAARDVTERKHAEQVLKESMIQLERSNRELQDFASIASHDLQEPLRAIQAFGERLQTKHSASLNDQGRDYLTRMHAAAGRMRSLIQDLLAYSRVTTQVMPFAPVDMALATRAVLSDLALRVEETGGHVEVTELPTIDADAMQMRQLLQNLIANGLKFHREEVPPLVKVYALLPVLPAVTADETLVPSTPLVQIVVEDNGIGFDEKFTDRIFSPFERLHTNSKYSGTGIGLAICRKIAERHGGSITVKSVPGQGSRFIIALPAKQPETMI